MVANTGTEKLVVTVISDLEIEMTRTFDAPRELVFEAHSKCEHLTKWWGRTGSTLAVCDLDFRPGGAWRFVERQSDGAEYGFHGEFLEVVRPERIVWTFEFEGMPGHVSVDTMTFEEQDGKTLLRGRTRFDSVEDRDGMLQSGMEEGAGETYDRLAEYLATLK
jgi:uncharacterized protein YndB with AHSA1/START domain